MYSPAGEYSKRAPSCRPGFPGLLISFPSSGVRGLPDGYTVRLAGRPPEQEPKAPTRAGHFRPEGSPKCIFGKIFRKMMHPCLFLSIQVKEEDGMSKESKENRESSLAGEEKEAYSEDAMALRIRALSDIVFKYIFGTEESTELLRAFVNAVLIDADYPPIEELQVVNPFNAKSYLDEKVSIIDTRAKDSKGNIYNVEVQIRSQGDFQERSLYYWASAYAGQLPKGHEYRKLHQVVSISILDFVLFSENIPFHSCFMLRENSQPDQVLSQDCVMHYLECPKLKREPVTEVERWLYLLLHAGEEDKKMQVLIDENEYFKKVMNRYKYFVGDEQARLAYEARQKYLHDQASYLADAREAGMEMGLEEGMEKGMEKGRKEGKLEVARNMIALGLSIEQVVQATTLSAGEVEAIASGFDQPVEPGTV
jgi:predicted transposase/invertase (TIGR01784 family)